MPLRADLLNPIASPENLRYNPIYDKIREARREDLDLPEGDWKRERKVADYALVVKLASEALANKSKDLQIAAWLAEAMLHREGISGFAQALQLIRDLLDGFWDTLYPEVEDDDREMRAGPLDWLGSHLNPVLKTLPLGAAGLTWAKYKESRAVGYEAAADSDNKRKKRASDVADGKMTAEEYDGMIQTARIDDLRVVYADIRSCTEAVEALGEICDEKFGGDAPSLRPLKETLEELGQAMRMFGQKRNVSLEAAAVPPVAPPPAPAPAAVAAPAPTPPPVYTAPQAAAAAPALAPIAAADGIDPVDKDDAVRRLAAIARFLRKQDQYNIDPFLILRGLRWGELRYNGAAIDTRMLEAPPPALRAELKRLAADSMWADLIEACERAMEQPCGRGWLDPQRYVVLAWTNMGQWYKEMATAVKTELRGLLTDLPSLPTLTLSDDTPTANPETLAWIRSEVLAAEQSAAPVARPEPPPPPQPPAAVEVRALPHLEEAPAEDETFAQALAAARSGKLGEAVSALSEQLARERSGRSRFRRRMQLAHIFMAAGHPNIAFPILEELAAEIERRGLEEWEPGTVLAYPLSLLLQCLRKIDGDETRKRELYARICRLDPVQALRCAK